MNEAAKEDDVMLHDVYEDLDKGRAPRSLKVLSIEGPVAMVINIKTERMSKIRIDRLRPGGGGSHGYRRIFRKEDVE